MAFEKYLSFINFWKVFRNNFCLHYFSLDLFISAVTGAVTRYSSQPFVTSFIISDIRDGSNSTTHNSLLQVSRTCLHCSLWVSHWEITERTGDHNISSLLCSTILTFVQVILSWISSVNIFWEMTFYTVFMTFTCRSHKLIRSSYLSRFEQITLKAVAFCTVPDSVDVFNSFRQSNMNTFS